MPRSAPRVASCLDAPLEISSARASVRNAAAGSSDRFEREQREFFERVRATYLDRARVEPNRFVLIDAAASVDTVTQSVRHAIETRLFRS